MIDDEDAAARTTLAVRRLVIATERHRLRTARTELGMGATEMLALGNLAIEGDRTPTQLAEHLRITTPSVTELVDRLERGGLVQRSPHRTDRRKVTITLSGHGRQMMGTVLGDIGRALSRSISDLSAEHLAVVLHFLDSAAVEIGALGQAEETCPEGSDSAAS